MTTLAQKEASALCMEHLVDHDWHGYTQDMDGRWGDGEGTCEVETPIGTCEVEQGDRDCATGVITSYNAAKVSTGAATYTGNMLPCMEREGTFRAHRMSDGYNCDDGYVARRGDCYLNVECHTAMCISDEPDMLAEFCIAENGGIYGETGDQLQQRGAGEESRRAGFYAYPWDYCLEAIVDGESPAPEPLRSEARGVQLYRSNGTEAQKWVQEWVDGTWFRLRNAACGKYLDVMDSDPADGTTVLAYPGTGGANQLWRYERRGDSGAVCLVPAIAEGKRLDCAGGGHAQGTGLIIWPFHGRANQEFVPMDNRDGTVTLINNSLGEKLALDVVNGGA